MDFRMDEDATAVAEAVRDLMAEYCDPSVVREQWERNGNRSPHAQVLWENLIELGAPELLTPAADGGLELGEQALVAVMEEAGRHACPLPLLETILLSPVVARHAPQSTTPLIAWAPDGLAAPWGASADVIVTGGRPGNEMGLFSSPAPTSPVSTVDGGRAVAILETEPDPFNVTEQECETLWQRAVLGSAAELIGLSRTMLDLTVRYVKTREQFGRPIGGFQAIKHHLASATVAINFAQPLVWLAAWHLQEGSPSARAYGAMAKARASRVAVEVSQICIQSHGAMGYTTEYDLHLFAKRAWALAASFGDTDEHISDLLPQLPSLMARTD